MKEILLEAQQLCYHYEEGRLALDHVSAAIHRGERLAVLGSNGAGKSTFFLCCNGVLRPQGRLLYRGRPVDVARKKDRMELRRRVGIVFQEPDNQIIAPTVRAEISFGPLNLGLGEEQAGRQTDRAMEAMELTAYAQRAPQYLSGGEKKRVTIADVLAMEPEIILLDEPAASLDPAGAAQLEQTLDVLHRQGIALVVSTHDVDFAYLWAQRCLVFCGGRILAEGPLEAIFDRPEVVEQARLRQPTLYRVAKALGLPKEEGWPKGIEELEQRLGGGQI